MTQTTSPFRALLNLEASASLPKLSSAQMLDAPENSAIRDIWVSPPDNPNLHAGLKHGGDGKECIHHSAVQGLAQVDRKMNRKMKMIKLSILMMRRSDLTYDHYRFQPSRLFRVVAWGADLSWRLPVT